MPKITLQRSTELEFEYPLPDGTTGTVIVPAVTVGQYRAALQREAEAPADETPAQAQDRLLDQARLLCGAQAGFLDHLDPEMVIEVMQCLLSVYAGLPPDAALEVQRALKKKHLLEALTTARPAASTSATG